MTKPLPNSASLFKRAQRVLPGGVSRNTLLRGSHPVYVKDAKGVTVTDVDGVERLDFSNNMSSLIHGHAHPATVAALLRAGDRAAFLDALEFEPVDATVHVTAYFTPEVVGSREPSHRDGALDDVPGGVLLDQNYGGPLMNSHVGVGHHHHQQKFGESRV